MKAVPSRNSDRKRRIGKSDRIKEFNVRFWSMIYSSSPLEYKFITIDDYAKDGGKELFTKMHCVRIENK